MCGCVLLFSFIRLKASDEVIDVLEAIRHIFFLGYATFSKLELLVVSSKKNMIMQNQFSIVYLSLKMMQKKNVRLKILKKHGQKLFVFSSTAIYMLKLRIESRKEKCHDN